ncbi:efflux RND transporter permease subunit [uncultured Ruminococcus sp.]|uniref:efflux RND transporter permease subunit n=1 Tax=uncultured Ruminococcus sp. TaxID=165186 RepID=UPI00292DA9EC|nr:efflux RND transporter permease subunit [uncultured Ruminococcus sp.]
MISKFSVKKPMTIFVAVIMVIVLGVVAFTRMTPDLLPNMDLPYAMVLTTYAGQTPETVEKEVTKPLEQSLAIVDGVKQLTSQSAENYSLLIIEFNDGTDMNTATVDMRTSIDAVADAWSDTIGTPYLIKLNPNMLPVAMTAVDYEGKDRGEISSFVSDELINKLEGVDGVASVSKKGLLTERENIVLSQKKLDKLNKKITAALDSKFADAEDKIKEARSELDKNVAAAEDGAGVISSSLDEISNQQAQLGEQLADAQTQADDGKTKMLSAKMELLDQKASLAQTKQVLELSSNALLTIKAGYNDLLKTKAELSDRIDALTKLNDRYISALEELLSPETTPERRQELNDELEKIDRELEPYGIKKEGLAAAIAAANAALAQADSSIGELNQKLRDLGTDFDSIDNTINSLSEQIAQINSGIEQIDAAISGLDDQTLTVSQALATISQQQSNADFQMSSAVAALTAKQTEVTAAAAQLDAAQKELDSSLEQISEQKKTAADAADMDGKVTLDNVSGILMAQSFSMPAGYVSDDNGGRYLVRVGDEVRSEQALSDLVLFDTKIDSVGVVRLSDVADVFISDNSDEIYAKIDGNDGVILSFSKQSNIATSTVCNNLNAEMRELEEKYDGLKFRNLYSQGDYIAVIIGSVLQNLLMGAVLAIIILFLFLRDIKPTVIVACSIPVSVIFAIVMMYISGISLNMISLSGLAIGVGMLVDNSVVVIENIYRLRSKGISAPAAAVNGARQVAGAIAASTLTTICVFVPIVFVQGLTRQLFVDMALTIGYSLIASLIIALTLVPAMSQRMLRKIRDTKQGEGRMLRTYERSLRFVLRHKAVSIIVVIALLFGSGLAVFSRGFSFMPEMSGTEVSVSVTLSDNATFDETVEAAEKVNEAMLKYDEFETVGVTVGGSMSLMGMSFGGSSGDAGSITAYGVLKSDATKKGAEISKKLEEELDGIGEITMGGSTTSMSSMLGDGSVQLRLIGDDLPKMQEAAKDIAANMEELDSVSEADSGMGATSPEIKVTVDRAKAAAKGLTVAQVFQQVAAAVSEEKTSVTLRGEDGKNIDVVIVKDDSNKTTSDTVGSIDLTYTDSEGKEKKTSLSSVADIDEAETLDMIRRTDQKRNLIISGTVADGYSLTAATNDVRSMMDSYDLPAGCTVEYDGSDKMTMEAMQQLSLMLLLGVVMIYLIMVAQFQSLKSPFIIMFTIPLAFTGGFLGLLVTGFDVSVISMIGFVTLCGIIVNNGIVLVDYINVLRLGGKERVEAIVEAGKTRMRPIFITALTTVLGLSVMALGIGTGAEMMQPLAIVCIGGLLYATFMTLFVIPLIYDAFNKREMKRVEEKELELPEGMI